jgi:hypothetical protein
LIEATNQEAESEEDYLVAKAVSHLIAARRIRFLNPKGEVAIEMHTAMMKEIDAR